MTAGKTEASLRIYNCRTDTIHSIVEKKSVERPHRIKIIPDELNITEVVKLDPTRETRLIRLDLNLIQLDFFRKLN
jgi:hypothetical protein